MTTLTAGPYCVFCRRFLREDEILPRKPRRTVPAVASRKLGDPIGRCRWHQAKDALAVAWVRRE